MELEGGREGGREEGEKEGGREGGREWSEGSVLLQGIYMSYEVVASYPSLSRSFF